MAWILPKGLVINANELNGSIERVDTEPLDIADIARFWKVYTTTKRRLLDPTAERLENFWWRMWGSRRRELKGAIVARLFAQISDGQSFVPLRGPPNRDEGTPPLNTRTRRGPGASSTTALYQSGQGQPRPSTTASSSVTSRAPPPMPHPILKKARGPSTSGPRPTARFISPPDSEGDADPNSSVSPNTHVVVRPPSPASQTVNPEKKPTPASSKKKGGFVASMAARKKTRPVIARRQSSQTSQSSTEPSSRAVEGEQVSDPALAEQLQDPTKRVTQSRFQENFSPSPERSSPGAKPPRSRPEARNRRHLSPRRTSSRGRKEGVEVSREPEDRAGTGEPTGPRSHEHIQERGDPRDGSTAEELEEREMQRLPPEEAMTRPGAETTSKSHVIAPATSAGVQALHSSHGSGSNGLPNAEGTGAMCVLPREAKSAASLAPTLAAATGQVGLTDVGLDAPLSASGQNSPAAIGKGKGRDPEEVSRAKLFVRRPVQPVQPTPAPDTTGPLSRSKSQLTLLLERDRANGEKAKPSRSGSKTGGEF